MEQTDKKVELHPARLTPPPEAIKRIIEVDKKKLPHNPVMRFVKIFFGEGF